jgi:aminopeptidase N
MIQTLIGRDAFRAAWTVLRAPRRAGGDLRRFRRGDGRRLRFRLHALHALVQPAGTPHVTVDGVYDAAIARYTLTCTQSTAAPRRGSRKKPYLIPIRVGWFDGAGFDLIAGERTRCSCT